MVRCRGDVDIQTLERLEKAIADLLEEGVIQIAVDMAGVSYISSAGMGVLISARIDAAERGGRLTVVNPSPAAAELLKSVGLDDLF